MGNTLEKFAEDHLVPKRIENGEHPSTERKLKTVGVLAAIYYIAAFKIFKPLLRAILSKHPQWAALGQRRGTFNPDAQDEVIYVATCGIHHSICAYLMIKGLLQRKDTEKDDNAEVNGNSLILHGSLLEFAFEWVDFALMIIKAWPYQERDPAFTTLIVTHHMLGLLGFEGTSKDRYYKPEMVKFMIAMLGMAGLGTLVYPVQQLLDLNTRSGLYKAIALNSFNTVCHIYVRFYIYFTTGTEMLKDIYRESERKKKENGGKQDMYPTLATLGGCSLTIFNVLVLAGLGRNMAKYVKALGQVKN